MRRNRLVPVVAVVGAIALLGAACSDDDDNDASSETTTPVATEAPDDPTTTTMAAGDTIVDLAVATPDLSTLVEAVTAAGLVDTLSGEGPFTVFAPTNEAFAAIPAETLESILADQELLTKILTYHVVSGDFPADAVAGLPDVGTGADVETVEGQSVTIVASDAGVTVNGANVVQADVVASNGVVHVIDQVLLPPDVQL